MARHRQRDQGQKPTYSYAEGVQGFSQNTNKKSHIFRSLFFINFDLGWFLACETFAFPNAIVLTKLSQSPLIDAYL